MLAIQTLEEAIEAAETLGYEARQTWRDVAQGMFVPVRATGVVPNHDAYRANEEKGETPEVLAALFPFGCQLPAGASEERTLEYYLRLAPKYVGAPMLSAPLGVYGAWAGHRDEALRLFEDGYAAFRMEPFTSTDEYSPSVFPEMPRAGPFFANMGGFLASLYLGLPGIRPNGGEPARWPERPVVLPAGWRSIEVERLWVRGAPIGLEARHGASRARLIRS
jgi:hypothetical protein